MHNPEGSTGQPQRFYARARNRVRASVADSMLYGTSLLVLLLAIELADVRSAVGVPLFWAWVVAALAYEPVLVSWRGATLGHALYNLYVTDAVSGRPPALWRAVARTLLKAVFGLPSFAFMALTRRHQALHDIITGTLVEVSDLARARPDELLEERPLDALVVPVPRWRRVLVIAGWLAVCGLAWTVSATALHVVACPHDRCPPLVTLVDFLLSLAGLAAIVGCLVLGWRGQLPGARP